MKKQPSSHCNFESMKSLCRYPMPVRNKILQHLVVRCLVEPHETRKVSLTLRFLHFFFLERPSFCFCLLRITHNLNGAEPAPEQALDQSANRLSTRGPGEGQLGQSRSLGLSCSCHVGNCMGLRWITFFSPITDCSSLLFRPCFYICNLLFVCLELHSGSCHFWHRSFDPLPVGPGAS